MVGGFEFESVGDVVYEGEELLVTYRALVAQDIDSLANGGTL